MAGKRRVVDRSVRWSFSFKSENDIGTTVEVRGGPCPVLTLASLDAVEREYLKRQIEGIEVAFIECEIMSVPPTNSKSEGKKK